MNIMISLRVREALKKIPYFGTLSQKGGGVRPENQCFGGLKLKNEENVSDWK